MSLSTLINTLCSTPPLACEYLLPVSNQQDLISLGTAILMLRPCLMLFLALPAVVTSCKGNAVTRVL